MLGQQQYGMVIGNKEVQWTTPKDPGRYDDTIQAKDTAFDRSESEKRHSRQVNEYEKFLGVEESLHTLILQVVDYHTSKHSKRNTLDMVAEHHLK